jgi:bzd-type benzoyl-CoA reductase N subunit
MSEANFSFFQDIVRNRHELAREFAGDRKIIGYFCDFVPEELLHAAGYTPIRITGTKKPISLADRYLQSNVCSFARGCLELVLDGTYRYLSGVVIPHSCDVITKMNDLWAYRVDYPEFHHYLWYPHKAGDPNARTAFIDELRRLKSCLEDFTGSKISDDSLRESIGCYNESRRLLKRAYEMRMGSEPAMSGAESLALTLSAMLSPRQEHSKKLGELLDALDDSQGQSPAIPASASGKRPRILVSASVLDDEDLVSAIEELGGIVVCDDVCTGIRYFWGEVSEADTEGDPLEALADRYLNKIPCPRTFESGARIDFMMDNVRDYSVDGVIMYILRCCDAHLFEMPGLRDKLKAGGTPVLNLQGDHSASISEETRNRIAAFIEMLGG